MKTVRIEDLRNDPVAKLPETTCVPCVSGMGLWATFSSATKQHFKQTNLVLLSIFRHAWVDFGTLSLQFLGVKNDFGEEPEKPVKRIDLGLQQAWYGAHRPLHLYHCRLEPRRVCNGPRWPGGPCAKTESPGGDDMRRLKRDGHLLTPLQNLKELRSLEAKEM